jgi:hypothetical protein
MVGFCLSADVAFRLYHGTGGLDERIKDKGIRVYVWILGIDTRGEI